MKKTEKRKWRIKIRKWRTKKGEKIFKWHDFNKTARIRISVKSFNKIKVFKMDCQKDTANNIAWLVNNR